jgi:hypothetical protein
VTQGTLAHSAECNLTEGPMWVGRGAITCRGPLFVHTAFGIVCSESRQRDVPKSRYFMAALVPAAGEMT